VENALTASSCISNLCNVRPRLKDTIPRLGSLNYLASNIAFLNNSRDSLNELLLY
jgi:hypothetical protein